MTDAIQRASGSSILLVDDSELTCESIKTTLEEAGFSVTTLNGPFGFIKTVRQAQPALVLIDVGLGTMNGTKLVPLGRQHAPTHTRFLLFSGRDKEELARDVSASGADGFISKRESPTMLLMEVRKWLARAR